MKDRFVRAKGIIGIQWAVKCLKGKQSGLLSNYFHDVPVIIPATQQEEIRDGSGTV